MFYFLKRLTEVLRSSMAKFKKQNQNKEDFIYILEIFYLLSLFNLDLVDVSEAFFQILVNLTNPAALNELANAVKSMNIIE